MASASRTGSASWCGAPSARVGEVDRAVRGEIREGRARLVEDGVPVETYRRIELDEALALLAPARERAAAA